MWHFFKKLFHVAINLETSGKICMVAVIVPWGEGTLLSGLYRELLPDDKVFGITSALKRIIILFESVLNWV